MNCNIPVLLIGAAFFAVGVLLTLRQWSGKKNNTLKTTAYVTRYDTEQRYDTDTASISIVYFPVLSYRANGRQYEKRDSVGSGKKKYEIGQQLDILCDPRDPQRFFIKGDRSAALVATAALAIGTGVILLSFFAH